VLAFHLDEHIDHAVASGLRARGINVTTTQETGLLGADDTSHLAYTLQAQRVMVTCDSDYLALAASGVHHAGIAFVAPHAMAIGHMVRQLCLMSDCLEPAEMFDKVEFL
jgi:hypothetical protein